MENAWFALVAICALLFWGVIIGVVVWAIRSAPRRQADPLETQYPVKIAERRFAQGEISRQELGDIKKTLNR